MKQQVNFKKVIFAFLIIILLIPFTQDFFHLFEFSPLNGVFSKTEKPKLTLDEWSSGSFQTKYEEYLEQNIGLRNLFVRANNQLDFSLFNIAHSAGVVVGKNDFLYEEQYINSYLGRDFVGEDVLNSRLRKLKFIQDTLKQKSNIDLILILAPGKASFYPEYIPDRYNPEKKTISNYDFISKRAQILGLNILDFNKYFLNIKNTTKYPLYPKCSIHWSTYGSMIAADSIVRYIEKLRNIDMPDILWNGFEFSDTIRNTDYDIGEGMNLLWEISYPRMAYPRISFKSDSSKTKPVVLGIGDSFYKNFYYDDIPQNLFIQNGFWYYNKEVENSNDGVTKQVKQLNYREEIEKQNVIILIASETNLWRFPFGFTENAYDLYSYSGADGKMKNYRKLILLDPDWCRKLQKRSEENHKTFETILNQEIESLIANENEFNKKTEKDLVEMFEKKIYFNEFLLSEEIKKAKQKGIKLEECIKIDGKWLFDNEFGFVKNEPTIGHELKYYEDQIKNNPELMKAVEKKAKDNKISIAEMIRRDASWLLEDAKKKSNN